MYSYTNVTFTLSRRTVRNTRRTCPSTLFFFLLQIDDDNLSKLEKADILELTVNHLTKLHRPKDPVIEAKKFQAGFGQCAAEACRFIMSVPELDTNVSQNLVSHLSRLITAQPLTIQVPDRPPFSPPTSPSSVVSDRQHYYSDHDRSSSDAEDSMYAGDSSSKQWVYRTNARTSMHANAPLTGLLTTVDKMSSHHTEQLNAPPRNGAYFSRVPAEAKDVILRKIRQHIMDKRGSEHYNTGDMNINAEPAEPKYLHRDEPYGADEDRDQHSPPNVSNNNITLDLRKVRSPTKPLMESSPKRLVAYGANQLDVVPSESKVEVTITLPEKCELPMDYSNLPPKKKRKLIEYQEYKKQEEARRQLDAFYAEKKDRERPPAELDADGNKWRPW